MMENLHLSNVSHVNMPALVYRSSHILSFQEAKFEHINNGSVVMFGTITNIITGIV